MTRCRPALGTFVEIRVEAVGPRAIDALDAHDALDASGAPDALDPVGAIDAAFAAIDRVDALMSFHRASSELSRLNRAVAGEVLLLDPWTVEVLALAIELHRGTDGLFDCAVGGELVAAGLLPGARPAHGSGSIADVIVVDATRVRVDRPVCLDLGGIAKGFAVDKAIDALRACGIGQASVNAGGDLRVLGDRAEPVRVRSPIDRAHTVEIGTLADGAIATSSGGLDPTGRWRSALIDPRSRSAIDDRRSFSVLADRCAVADGLTKALAVAGHLPPACLDRFGATALVL